MTNRVVVRITPSAGTVVRAGDTIQIKIETTGGEAVKGVVLYIGRSFENFEGPGPFSFPYKIPKKFIGKLTISAEAVVSESEFYSGATFVIVQPIAPIVSITTSPSEKTLHLNKDGRGSQSLISVDAQLANGTTIDISSSNAGTSYSLLSGGTVVTSVGPSGLAGPVLAGNVISVSPNGVVKALGIGEDVVLISNSGFSTAMIVTVNPLE